MVKKAKTEYQIPQWMECAWRRVPCGKKSCPICGRLAAQYERHIEAGEDPNDMEMMFADVAHGFKETLELIKQDAKSKGIDIQGLNEVKEPPRPQAFPLYRKVSAWYQQVSFLAESADAGGDLWLATEAGADLIWYKNILLSKVYRQLCTRWEKKQGLEYGDTDLRYTGKILKEVAGILTKSLEELTALESAQKGGLFLSLVSLQQLKKQIVKL